MTSVHVDVHVMYEYLIGMKRNEVHQLHNLFTGMLHGMYMYKWHTYL